MAFTVFVIILIIISYNIYKFISERKKQAILAKEKWYREEAERKREQEKYEREQKISARLRNEKLKKEEAERKREQEMYEREQEISARLRNEKLKKEETEKESARESTKRREEFLSSQKEKFKNAVESIDDLMGKDEDENKEEQEETANI